MGLYSNGTQIIAGGNVVGGLEAPTWVTAAGSLGTLWDSQRSSFSSFISSLSATSTTGTSYTVTSGSLPSGLTLNTNGTWSGTPSSVGSDTTYTFTVTARAILSTDRSFSITLKAPVVQSFNYTGSDQTFTVPSGLTALTIAMWGAGGTCGDYTSGSAYTGAGGGAGSVQGTMAVTAGETLTVRVGQGISYVVGAVGTGTSTVVGPAFGGGGQGGIGDGSGSNAGHAGAGGGATSFIRSGSFIATAAGGGGAAGAGYGGANPSSAGNPGGSGNGAGGAGRGALGNPSATYVGGSGSNGGGGGGGGGSGSNANAGNGDPGNGGSNIVPSGSTGYSGSGRTPGNSGSGYYPGSSVGYGSQDTNTYGVGGTVVAGHGYAVVAY